MKSDLEKWDKKYQGEEFAYGKKPNVFLKKHLKSLEKGFALDLAHGRGEKCRISGRGRMEVDAVDISPVGVRKAGRLAKEGGVG